MIRIRAVLAVCAALFAAPAFGASPDPKDLVVPPEELSKARELVRRMGSEVYREREEAQAELAKMGRIAKQVLAEAVITDADPEIRLRASRLLPKASAADLQARIDTFLADTDSKYDHDLPGLKTFRKHLATAEKDKTRALYVEILKSPYNLEMFAAIDKGETEGGRAVADRRNAMWNDMQHRPFPPNGKPVQPRQPSLSDIAALLFAESVIEADHIPKTNAWNFVNGTQFIQQPAAAQALNGSGATHAEAFKVIVRQWLATRTDVNELTNLSYQLNNQQLKQFPETLILLRRIITTEGVQGYAKGQALNTLIQQRGKEETPFLKTLMHNDAMVQQVWFGRPNGQPEMHNCLMKDVALAFLITQAGGNIKDYGFETPPGVIIQPGNLGYGQYAFTQTEHYPTNPLKVIWGFELPQTRVRSAEERRAAAFMKWGFQQMKTSTDGPAPKDGPKTSPRTPRRTVRRTCRCRLSPSSSRCRRRFPRSRGRPRNRPRRSVRRPSSEVTPTNETGRPLCKKRAAGFICGAVPCSTHRRGSPLPRARRTAPRTPPAARRRPTCETPRPIAARPRRAGTPAREAFAARHRVPVRCRSISGRSREQRCPSPEQMPRRGTGRLSVRRSPRASPTPTRRLRTARCGARLRRVATPACRRSRRSTRSEPRRPTAPRRRGPAPCARGATG
jgi:hypothetical protein